MSPSDLSPSFGFQHLCFSDFNPNAVREKEDAPTTNLTQRIFNTAFQLKEGFIQTKDRFYEVTTCNRHDLRDSQAVNIIDYLLMQQGKRLTSKHLYFYLQLLQEKFPRIDCYHEGYTLPATSVQARSPYEVFKKNPSIKPLLFFPFLFDTHITLAIIDKEKRAIQFFDPLGLSVNHSDRQKLYPNFNLRIELFRLASLIFQSDDFDYKENERQIQDDIYSCGIHVARFIRMRAEGVSYDSIVSANIPPVQEQRDCMAREIAQHIKDKDIDKTEAERLIFLMDEDLE